MVLIKFGDYFSLYWNARHKRNVTIKHRESDERSTSLATIAFVHFMTFQQAHNNKLNSRNTYLSSCAPATTQKSNQKAKGHCSALRGGRYLRDTDEQHTKQEHPP